MVTVQCSKARKDCTRWGKMWRKPDGSLIGLDQEDQWSGPTQCEQLQACPAMPPTQAPPPRPPGDTRQGQAAHPSSEVL